MTRAFLILLFLWPSTAGASPPCSEAKPLLFGDTVPCTQGILLPVAWATDCLQCRDVSLPRCKNDLSLLTEQKRIEANAFNERLAALQSFSNQQTRLLEQALNTSPKWYESPYFWGAVSFVVGVGLTVSVVYAVDK